MENNFITTMLIIMLSFNVFLGLVDYSMASMDSSTSYFNYANTVAGNMTAGNAINGSFEVGYSDVTVDMADTITADAGSSFTDSPKTVNSWWNKMNNRFGIAGSIVSQPAGFMKQIGLPIELANAFGAIWYGLASLALILLIAGRS